MNKLIKFINHNALFFSNDSLLLLHYLTPITAPRILLFSLSIDHRKWKPVQIGWQCVGARRFQFRRRNFQIRLYFRRFLRSMVWPLQSPHAGGWNFYSFLLISQFYKWILLLVDSLHLNFLLIFIRALLVLVIDCRIRYVRAVKFLCVHRFNVVWVLCITSL